MPDEAINHDVANLASELDAALVNLDVALTQAGSSVSVIRANISQIATLAEAMCDMEAAITLARQNLSLPLAGTRQPADSPPLRAVPAPTEPQPAPQAVEPQPTPQAAEPEPEQAALGNELRSRLLQPEPVPQAAEPQPAPQVVEPEPALQATEPEEAVSHCLRLAVNSKSGSLDLKAVDASVNENPAVVDVALLDYDGRKATLKLWVNESADPIGVRDALLGSLRRRLSDEQAAEVRIDFEESAAA